MGCSRFKICSKKVKKIELQKYSTDHIISLFWFSFLCVSVVFQDYDRNGTWPVQHYFSTFYIHIGKFLFMIAMTHDQFASALTQPFVPSQVNSWSANFQQLNENDNRMTTRAKANNFYKPSMCTNTFTYSAIDEWNSLPNNVKAMKNGKMFKESLKKTLLKHARKSDESPFVYY